MKENEFKNVFKVPEDYFSNLKDEIYLKKIKDQESFKVPTNYFETLEQSILEQTIQSKQTKVFQLNYWLVAACVILLAIISVPMILNNQEKQTNQVVDTEVKNKVYEKIYDTYIVTDQNKKSSNVTLDDSDFVLYNY
ncbi:hypothetical protein [Algoriella sp.]|uniref:hypothetical protein n=1 Tax=Algoriella sp. TaxID=1872434 RepID=UPI001B2227F2|nr:hypothetical protein [Algoriella sp.]MBO6212752.1 hypothetical protein [Algoriella sp.]